VSDEIQIDNPFTPQNISELLPKSDQDFKVTFIAIGPKLLDALNKGKNIVEASHEAGISEHDAVKLLASPEFNRLKEAYLSIGDLEDKTVRVRIAKSILAAQIAAGVTFRKREPMDILEYVRREFDVKRGEHSVNVFIKNDIVPRPYLKDGGVKESVPSERGTVSAGTTDSLLPQNVVVEGIKMEDK
jgi:hypothetical protein